MSALAQTPRTTFRPFDIQRLKRPRNGIPATGMNRGVLGFLSEGSNAELGKTLRLDYMGNTRFEGHAVPDAWNAMYDRRADLRATAITVNVAREPRQLSPSEAAELPERFPVRVFVIAYDDTMSDVLVWLEDVQATAHMLERETREEPRFTLHASRSILIDADARHPDPVVGWWDLKLGFFYFLDEEMFKGVKTLFKVA